MPDDRAVEEPVDQVARLQRELDDFKTTLTSRLGRRPTGDIEETIRSTPKQNTLICNGQTVNRADYPALWQWAQDNALVVAGAFGSGDGTATFTVPDYRGRVMRGAGAGDTVGAVVGADSLALTTANLPSHSHSLTIDADGQHQHDFLTAQGGAHGGHFPATQAFLTPAGSTYGLAAYNDGGVGSGTHNHSGTTAYNSNHTHSGTAAATGSGTAMDNRQASFNGNWLIWV